MKIGQYVKLLMLVGLAAMLGCGNSSDDITAPPPSSGGGPQIAPAAVYVLTNNGIPNTISQYRRTTDGSLSYVDDFSTGGNGDGTDLEGTYGALTFQSSTNRFFAVNPGSNTISAMILGTDGSMSVLSTVSSNGTRPVSIATVGDLVYVLNYGDVTTNQPANISGFRFTGSQLQPIANSTQFLSSAHPDAAQIGIHPTGSVVVVTERGNDNIVTFVVDAAGAVGTGVSRGTNGLSPSGFDFTPNGLLIVAEANDSVVGQGTTSVYNVAVDGSLVDLTVARANGQTGTSSAKSFNFGPYVFAANTDSDNISTYSIDGDGNLTLQGNGNAAATGQGPTDLGVSYDYLYLYSLNRESDTVSTFSILDTGTLVSSNSVLAVPASSVGMVVR